MLTTQQATSEQCQLIHDMANIVFRNTYREILSPEQLNYMMDWMYSIESLTQQITQDGHVYFIGYWDGEPCGYVSVQPHEQDIYHLQKIYVMPNFQGKSIGKSLFHKAIEYIKSVHPTPCLMELNVNRNNPAVTFYERLGMKKLREGDFEIGNGYYMNDYIMGIEI